jgi:CHAT domain-containing protein/tetratricopeptide (TPR) repeat protein
MSVAGRRGLWRTCAALAVMSIVAVAPAASHSGQALPQSPDPRALLDEGRALLKQRRAADADRTLQAAIEAANQSNLAPDDKDRVVGDASLMLGGMRQLSGQSGEAAAYSQQALAAFERLNDDAGIARALVRVVSSTQLPLAKEEPLLERALRHARAAGVKESEADALHLWGDGLFAEGQYERALVMLREAEPVAKAAGDTEELGTIYNSMGRLYRNHGQFETALDYQLKALGLHERQPGSLVLMQSLNAVGVTYQAMGDNARGRVFLNRALETAIATSSSARIQDFIRANLVDSMIEEGSYAETALMLEGVIARKLDNYPQLRHTQLADVYRAMGRLDAAITTADKAIELCSSAREDNFCVHALNTRAEVHLALGNRAGALADLNAALAMLERIRARLVPQDFFRQNFGRSLQATYSRTIEMQITDGDVGKALETAELARSRAFIDLLAGRDVAMQEGAKSAPAATIADLSRVAARLGSTLVMYWVTPERLFIWTVSPAGDVRASTVAVRESKLAELVRSTAPFSGARNAPMVALSARSSAGFAIAKADANNWRELYNLLIRPIRSSLPRGPAALVTIVPHGPLSMLSFAALQDERDRYLIENFTLHYVPAGAVLDFTAARRRADARTSNTLVVADPSYRRKSTLDPQLPALPGSRAEARAIARLSPKERVTLLEGDAATEQRVRDLTSGKGVLHFATHAIVSDADPFNSFLALGGSSTPADDGTLTAQEIYGLTLQADVVVLSACRSGGGRVTGDGMSTFARAFMYAGTPSLITSVWDVADESSAQLVPGFYREWRAGASKARALRNTQLAFLKSLRAGNVRVESVAGPVVLPEHPALWAGFMLIGEPD